MSLSESQRELLLSASLDDALNPEEQAMLDQWLREDPLALRQRDELAAMGQQLRAALAPTRQARLGEGFAQRVVEAAIAQAQQENLAATHPLVRLANPAQRAAGAESAGTQPADQRPAAFPSSRWRRGAACLALAASLLIALYLGRPRNDHNGDATQPLAQADSAGQASGAGPGGTAGVEVADLDAAGRSAIESIEIAAVDSDATPAATDSTAEAMGPPQPGQGQAFDSVASSDAARLAAQSPRESTAAEPGALAARSSNTAPQPSSSAPQPSTGSSADPQAIPLQAVLVMSVEMTPAGRESLALLEALRAADIQIGPEGIVNDQVVAQLQQSNVIQSAANDHAAKLYYIEAPAKQLDRFLLRLMAEKDSFASFGFSIANNPPLLASVSEWRELDPTKFRHTNAGAIARDLVATDGAPLSIDQGAAFIPMPRELGTGGLLGPAPASGDNGQDIPSQILLLIR